MRRGIPIATLDTRLTAAAKKTDVPIHMGYTVFPGRRMSEAGSIPSNLSEIFPFFRIDGTILYMPKWPIIGQTIGEMTKFHLNL